MNANNIKTTIVHPDLKHLIQQPINKDPSKLMETAPKNDRGFIIDAWNGYLLCDTAIYEACISGSFGYEIIDHAFTTIDEAGAFLCESQLQRKDLTNSFRKYLIGKCFGYEQSICRSKYNDTSSKYRIAYKIGDTQNLSGGAVLKYHAFSTAIDLLLKNAEEFGKLLLMEQIKVSHENTIELSRLTPNELKHLAGSATEQRLRHLTYQDIVSD